MKKKLSTSLKIDATVAEILDILSTIAEKARIPFFVVGATARDMFFESRRATIAQLDLGIQIATWKLYDELMSNLFKTGYFNKTETSHRIIYKKYEYPVDIVPFGLISESDGNIIWPDNNKMSILGFEESFQNCYEIEISKSKFISVSSPVGLFIMKLISWSENSDRSENNAQDIDLILSNYHSILDNSSRVFDELSDLLIKFEYDIQRSGCALLGKDTLLVLQQTTTFNVIKKIIDYSTNESTISKLGKRNDE